jgi:hypothetical protein
MFELQKNIKRNQLHSKSRRTLATVRMTLIIMAIPLMLILSITTIPSHSSSSSSSSIHSVYAQQGVDDQNRKTANVSVDGNTYTIKYNATNARVLSIVPEKESAKVVVTIEPTKEGKLTIDLPRELIDYKIAGNKDGNFIVHINAKQISTFKENIPSTGNNKTSRALEINFGSGDRTIEIIGTQMAQASVADIKKQLQKEEAAAAAANKTKEASLLANKTMTKNITNAPKAGGAASIINKTGEVAKTFVNKTTGVLSNITKSLVGGK